MARMKSKLRSMRLSIPISQNRLAAAAGVDRKTISDAENGKSSPQDVTWAKIAKALSNLKGETISPEHFLD